MRLANADGRLTIVPPAVATIVDGGRVEGIDVETASHGRFGPDPHAVYPVWDEFRTWARDARLSAGTVAVEAGRSGSGGAPPRPGLRHRTQLRRACRRVQPGLSPVPPTFTKFPTCLAGPSARVPLPEGSVDWEVELVAVMGRTATGVARDGRLGPRRRAGRGAGSLGARAADDGIGPPVQSGQVVPQLRPHRPRPGDGGRARRPRRPGHRVLRRRGDGPVVPHQQMVFSVPDLVVHLSSVLTLLPGDVIFTGTPSGVGMGRTPRGSCAPVRWSRAGSRASAGCATRPPDEPPRSDPAAGSVTPGPFSRPRCHRAAGAAGPATAP